MSSIIRWITTGLLIAWSMTVYGQVDSDAPLVLTPFERARNVLTSRMDGTDERKSDEYKALFSRLMDEYDKEIRSCTDNATVWGNKALDYLHYAPRTDEKTVYPWLKTAVELSASSASPAVTLAFLETSMRLATKDAGRSSCFLQDYEQILCCARQFTAAERQQLDSMLIDSELVDGKLLQQTYAPRVKTCGRDGNVLRSMQCVMEKLGFADNFLYVEISDSLNRLSPSPETAMKLGNAFCVTGSVEDGIACFEQALSLETDSVAKAELAYAAADALRRYGQWSKARSFCQQALRYRENYGKAYMLMADLYASDIKWSRNSELNKCTYFLVIDKLMQAKAVAPELTGEVDKAISMYATHTPKANDLFMLGYRAGDRITIGGWIGETTTIR